MDGYNVGNTAFGGFVKGKKFSDLELLVITPTAAFLEKICMEHQQGQRT
jgi:hypothetical protein